MLNRNNTIECNDYVDFVDRLICNGFHFELDLAEQRIYIPSYQWREETWNDVGFHYYGKEQVYYISIDDINDVSSIISDAVDTMKNYIKVEVAIKLKEIITKHLGVE